MLGDSCLDNEASKNLEIPNYFKGHNLSLMWWNIVRLQFWHLFHGLNLFTCNLRWNAILWPCIRFAICMRSSQILILANTLLTIYAILWLCIRLIMVRTGQILILANILLKIYHSPTCKFQLGWLTWIISLYLWKCSQDCFPLLSIGYPPRVWFSVRISTILSTLWR